MKYYDVLDCNVTPRVKRMAGIQGKDLTDALFNARVMYGHNVYVEERN